MNEKKPDYEDDGSVFYRDTDMSPEQLVKVRVRPNELAQLRTEFPRLEAIMDDLKKNGLPKPNPNAHKDPIMLLAPRRYPLRDSAKPK